MHTARQVILAKIESTYGVDPVPVEATDAVLVENPSWAFEGARMNDRPALRPSLGKLRRIFGGTLKQVTFDVELKGSGAAGTAPELGVLLRACGRSETIVPATSVAYAFVSDPTTMESITLYYFQDGIRHIITGCVGSVEEAYNAGEVGKYSFTFVGHGDVFTDVAMASPTYDSTVPAPVIGAGFTVGGFAAVINSLTISDGNEVSTPPSVNGADGYAQIRITGRDVTGSIDPELTLVATNDWIGDWKAGSELAIAMSVGVVAIALAKTYYQGPSQDDRDGILTLGNPFGAAENAGDDEHVITFTG